MALPKTAADFRGWMDNDVDAITSASRNPREAIDWVSQVEKTGSTFESLAAVPSILESLDKKIRSAISKFIAAKDSGNAALIAELQRKCDELRKADAMILGIQYLFAIKSFFRVGDTEEETLFELSALMEFEYPGNAQKSWFKNRGELD